MLPCRQHLGSKHMCVMTPASLAAQLLKRQAGGVVKYIARSHIG